MATTPSPSAGAILRAALADYLATHITPHRLRRIDEVLGQRTRWLTVVLEDLYQPQNASAVLRTCECLGLQQVHVVEDRNEYSVNRAVSLGAARWIDVVHWRAAEGRTIDACCQELRRRGYRLVAATPLADAVSVDDLDVTRAPVAVLFGTELGGLTPAAQARVEEGVHIPMCGFTESFNISVSAALVLRELSRRLRASGADWRLSQEERAELRLAWLRRSIRHCEELEARFLAERGEEAQGP